MSRRSHFPVCALIALAAILGGGSWTLAEQPPTATPPPAELKAAPSSPARPQVIYHLPRTSTYAATLHSQAKGQSNALPIDSTMPISLQMSRAAANAAAAQAQQESAPPVEIPNPAEVSRPRAVKRAKVQSHRAAKAHGPGNSHGDKSHKK